MHGQWIWIRFDILYDDAHGNIFNTYMYLVLVCKWNCYSHNVFYRWVEILITHLWWYVLQMNWWCCFTDELIFLYIHLMIFFLIDELIFDDTWFVLQMNWYFDDTSNMICFADELIYIFWRHTICCFPDELMLNGRVVQELWEVWSGSGNGCLLLVTLWRSPRDGTHGPSPGGLEPWLWSATRTQSK